MFWLSASALLRVANRVRSIPTDFGAERVTVQSDLILCAFLGTDGRGAESFFRASHPVPSSTPDAWLEAFVGHCVASVVVEFLVVPEVPEVPEAFCKRLDQFFWRSTTNMATLVRDFRKQGFEVPAEVVSGHCCTTFANWR